MAGYNNIDQAVVLPKSDYPQIEQQLYERGERRRMEEAARLAKDQQRSDNLMKMLGDEFTAKNYMTGTAADPIIVNDLSGMLKKHAADLVKNPNISMGELYMKIQNDIGNVSQKASMFKAANTAITEATKEFDKAKGVDGGAIRQLAIKRILAKAGNVDELSKVNPQEEIDNVIKEHPELYLEPGTAFDAALKDYRTDVASNNTVNEYAGVKKKVYYDAELFPFQDIARDPVTKKEILGPDGKAQVVTKSHVAMDEGQPLKIDGKPMMVMNDDVYARFTESRANRAILINDLKQFNDAAVRNGKPAIEEGTPEAEIVKNHLLWKRLKDVRAPKFKTDDEITKSNWKEQQEAGYSPASIARAAASGAASAFKQEQKLQGTDFATLLRGVSLNKDVLAGSPKEVVGSKNLVNITGTIGGIKLGLTPPDPTTRERKTIFGDVYVDPTDVGALTVKDQFGKVTTYKGEKLNGFLTSIAGYNGTTVNQVKAVLGLNVDASGNPKNVDREMKRQLGGETREANDAITKFKATGTKALKDFEGSGDKAALKPFIGKRGELDGQQVEIADITTDVGLWGLGSTNAVIHYQVVNPDGSLGTLEALPVSGAKSKIKKHLESFIK